MSSSLSLIDEVSNVIKQRTNLAYLRSTVADGMIHATKGFINQNFNRDIASKNTDWIRIVRLNKVSFNKWLSFTSHYYNSNKKSPYLSIYNKNYKKMSYSDYVTADDIFYMGVNIDTELKLTGYHYNICDIFNSYFFDHSASSGNSEDSSRIHKINNFIYKLIYVTEKNFLIGFIDKQAIMYIDSTLLNKIKEISYESFVNIVNKLISVYANANSLFFSLNVENIEDLMASKITSRLLTTISYDCKECTVISPDHIDLFEDFSIIGTLMQRLRETIKNQVEMMLEGTRWGVNSQYSYKQLLDAFLSSRYESDKQAKEKAFMQGLIYGNKFELAGWNLCDKRFNDVDTICWEKSVDIVPCRFFYKNQMYIINDSNDVWQNPYKITKLYVTGSGIMYCEGNHPNVSGGKVCMGDIHGKINMSDVNKLQQNLACCESLLTTINYDSPYDSSKKVEMLQHSVVANQDGIIHQNSQEDSEYIAQGTIIQDISFEDDPDNIDVADDADLHGPDYVENETVQPLTNTSSN